MPPTGAQLARARASDAYASALFALGLVALVTHAALGNVEWGLLMAGVAGALPGGWLGARLTGRISEETLRRAIGIALLAIAVAFVIEIAR